MLRIANVFYIPATGNVLLGLVVCSFLNVFSDNSVVVISTCPFLFSVHRMLKEGKGIKTFFWLLTMLKALGAVIRVFQACLVRYGRAGIHPVAMFPLPGLKALVLVHPVFYTVFMSNSSVLLQMLLCSSWK